MPITTPNLTLAITGGLFSAGMLGTSVPQLAAGIASGLTRWLPQVVVLTTDAGSAGAGSGASPFQLPLPVMVGAMLSAYVTMKQLGPMAPLEAVGLANGLVQGFAQGIMKTTHTSVGSGTAIVRLVGPAAFSSLMAGFASVGIKGTNSANKAQAISIALQNVFGAFSPPIPIVGSASPSGASGSGFGKIL